MSINHFSYTIEKNSLSKDDVSKIISDLTLYPEKTFGNFAIKPIKVYKETKKFVILPLYYAIEHFKTIKNKFRPIKIHDFSSCNISLRSSQEKCFDLCKIEKTKEYGGGIINLQTGAGKCFAPDTEILMYDGKIKLVQDITPGDVLMGDNSTPRNVKGICSGIEKMYKIKTNNTESYTVNASHIICVKNLVSIDNKNNNFIVSWLENTGNSRKAFVSSVEAIKFAKFIEDTYPILDISVKDYIALKLDLKGYRCSIDLPYRRVKMDPYKAGKRNLTNPDYIINSKQVRLEFLAGILDSKISYYSHGVYNIFWKYNMNMLLYLIRSLGLYACITNKHIIMCYGDNEINLPTKYKGDMIKMSLMYTLTIEELRSDIYFGFELDGNQRFLLGDFTVTHNTVLALKTISYFSCKTLILVNKIELLHQWKNEIMKFIPGIKIGLIQGKNFDTDADIVIGMIQTIALKPELTASSFAWVDLCIIDECHCIASEVFSKIMFKIRPRYLFGLSATLERKDKMEKLIKWYIGDVIYSDTGTSGKQESIVRIHSYTGKSSVEKTLRDGTPAVSSMLTTIANDMERNNIIIKIIKDICEDKDRNVLVISDRISQLKYLHSKLDNSGLFIGGLKKEHLELSKEKQILLGTYGLTSEGFNHPKLNCILFATPRSSITQAIGRIYRKSHDVSPLIVDIKDDFSIFKYQYYKRKSIYKKNISNIKFEYNKEEQICLLDETLDNYCIID